LYSGLQEVTYHFFAVCVAAIDGLLPLVAKATGYKISKEDKDVLRSFTPLRDYFEHMENRAPGKSRESEVVSEYDDGRVWRVVSGFHTDEFDRILLNNRPIDVTSRGCEAIEEIVARNYVEMKASCLEQVRRHYLQGFKPIPSPSEVPYVPLVSVYSVFDGGRGM
jgi:hypothetical protein